MQSEVLELAGWEYRQCYQLLSYLFDTEYNPRVQGSAGGVHRRRGVWCIHVSATLPSRSLIRLSQYNGYPMSLLTSHQPTNTHIACNAAWQPDNCPNITNCWSLLCHKVRRNNTGWRFPWEFAWLLEKLTQLLCLYKIYPNSPKTLIAWQNPLYCVINLILSLSALIRLSLCCLVKGSLHIN